jgi:hypothetical protein
MAEMENPYQTPAAHVADVLDDAAPDSTYIEGGRAVAAGRGFAWIREGWDIFRRQWGMWLVLVVIFVLIFVGIGFIPVLNLLITFFLPVFVAGLMTGCQHVARGGELELAHLFAGFRRNTGQLVLVGIIGFVLAFVAAIPISLVVGLTAWGAATTSASPLAAFGVGTLIAGLVTLALLVPINMAMWFAPSLVMLQDQSAPRAIGQSFRGCIKNIVPFLLYGVIALLMGIVATLTFGLAWFVFGPVLLCSVYAGYRDIFFAPR